MSRKATNHIIDLIESGVLDPKSFLISLLVAMSESDVAENLEHIQTMEDWPNDMRFGEDNESESDL